MEINQFVYYIYYDELGNLGTPTLGKLTSNSLKELYMATSRATDKLCSLGTWSIPRNFDHPRSISLHLPEGLFLKLAQGDALFSSLGTLIFRDLLFKLCFLLALDHFDSQFIHGTDAYYYVQVSNYFSLHKNTTISHPFSNVKYLETSWAKEMEKRKGKKKGFYCKP